MFRSRSLSIWLLLAVLFFVASGLAVLAARKNRSDTQILESSARGLSPDAVEVDGSRFRNLSLHPEAAKLWRKLGRRYAGTGVSVLIGEVETVDGRVPVRVVRQQNTLGESVEITGNGKNLSWSGTAGLNAGSGPTESDRSLIERIVFDSADAFILAQLRGAAYQIVGKNVRADLGGSDNYDGPLWTIVRVSYPATKQATSSETPPRLYYLNTRTGLLDKVISDVPGEEIVATLEGWTTDGGETYPSVIRWNSAGQQIMELRVVNFVRSDVR